MPLALLTRKINLLLSVLLTMNRLVGIYIYIYIHFFLDKREDFNECVVYIKVFEGGRCELLFGRSGRYTLYVPQLSFKTL